MKIIGINTATVVSVEAVIAPDTEVVPMIEIDSKSSLVNVS